MALTDTDKKQIETMIRKEIKDLVSYLKVFYNPKDSISWERVLNTPTRGVGDKTIEKIITDKIYPKKT